MNWLRFIFIIALLVIFVVTAIASIFGAGKVLTAVFRSYVFKVETCEYRPPKIISRIPETKEIQEVPAEPDRECKIDYNRSKEDISNGLAMFLVAAPLAVIFFRKTRKFIYEG